MEPFDAREKLEPTVFPWQRVVMEKLKAIKPTSASAIQHLAIHRIQILIIFIIAILFLAGGLLLLRNFKTVEQLNQVHLTHASVSTAMVEELVQHQLPLRRIVSNLKMAVSRFAYEFELFVLEETGDIKPLEAAFKQMLLFQKKLEMNWSREFPQPPVHILRGNVNMAVGIYEEAAEFESSGFGEIYRLAQDSEMAMANLIREMAKLEELMNQAALGSAASVFKTAQKVEAEQKELGDFLHRISSQNFLTLAITFFLIVLFQTFFYLFLKKRLLKFRKTSEEISHKGDLSKRIDIFSKDEFGRLANSFNKMLKILNDTTIKKEYLDNIIHSIIDTVIVIDLDTTIKVVNQSTLDILGYEKNELLGKPVSLILPKEFSPPLLTMLSENPSGWHATKEMEIIYVTKENHHVPMLFSSAIMYADGIVQGMLFVAQDIRSRKKIELENATLQAQLQQSLKMESIGTLAGGIAHDFNNILAIIIGSSELAIEDTPEGDATHSYLAEIKKASIRAANIVKQLLRFSQKTYEELSPIDVVPVIEDAINFLRSTIPANIDIRRNFLVTESTILADPTQINQIVMNLLINASQAIEEKTGVIELSLDAIAVDDDDANFSLTSRKGKYLRIIIRDNGPGIDPLIINRIFDPYFTTKEVGKGSGMGLAVVQGIVNNMNGGIRVDSTPGQGTSFTILFETAPESPEVATDTGKSPSTGKGRILFVDDEELIVRMTCQILKRMGYRVEAKTSPTEALELFRSQPDQFDIVLTDMAMPQMTGATLSEKILAVRPDMPIIICTGYSDSVDEDKAKALGIAGFVLKPIQARELGKVIQNVLGDRAI